MASFVNLAANNAPQLEGDALVEQCLRGPEPPLIIRDVLPTQADVDAEIAARRAVTEALLRVPPGAEVTLEQQLRPYGIHAELDAQGHTRYWIRNEHGVAVDLDYDPVMPAVIRAQRLGRNGFDARHRRLQRARQGEEATHDPHSQAQADADLAAFGQD